MATRTTKKPATKAKLAAAKRTKPATKKARPPRAKVTPGVLIPIQTFAPEPYDLKRPILAVVRPYDHEYTATFADADLTACGASEEEAVGDLKFLILNSFDSLSSYPKLGPVLAKRLAVLRDFITKREG